MPAAASPGVPGAAYDTSAEANTRFLADYGAQPDVKKLPDGLMYRVLRRRRATARRCKKTATRSGSITRAR
jgi:hypothetical protein